MQCFRVGGFVFLILLGVLSRQGKSLTLAESLEACAHTLQNTDNPELVYQLATQLFPETPELRALLIQEQLSGRLVDRGRPLVPYRPTLFASNPHVKVFRPNSTNSRPFKGMAPVVIPGTNTMSWTGREDQNRRYLYIEPKTTGSCPVDVAPRLSSC